MSSAPQDKADAGRTSDRTSDVDGTAAPTHSGDKPENKGGDRSAGSPEHGSIRVRYAGRTAVGLVREHNEDNLVIANLDVGQPSPRGQVCEDAIGPSGMMFAVCDGMGGAAAGEVASKMAVDVLLEVLGSGGPPLERDDLARRLVSAVQEAGRRIYAEAQKERTKRGMGTTATVAVLLDKILFVAEVGDSRAYLLRNGVLRQLTKDQSLVNQLIEAGHLTEEEAEAFEHSNIILQALGTSESVQVDLTFVELRRGDRLMLCSDGLSGLVHDESIRDALHEVSDPAECTSLLVDYAEGGGGHDNITVIVADFDGDALSAAKADDDFGYVQYPLLPAGGVPSAFDDDEDAGRREHVQPIAARSEPPQRSSAGWLWLLAGLVALGGGAYLLFVTSPESERRGRLAVEEGAPAETARSAAEEAEPASQVPVVVRVHTDVEEARLMVNGEAYGPLSASESFPLKLPPGAYRFEAEAEGNILAVSVQTVRPEEPLDVYLNLPKGSSSGRPDEDTESQGPGFVQSSEQDALNGEAAADALPTNGDFTADGAAVREQNPTEQSAAARRAGSRTESGSRRSRAVDEAPLAERNAERNKARVSPPRSSSQSSARVQSSAELPAHLQRDATSATTLRPTTRPTRAQGKQEGEPALVSPARPSGATASGASGMATGSSTAMPPVLQVSPESPISAPGLPENPY